jgi:hypothetical protein
MSDWISVEDRMPPIDTKVLFMHFYRDEIQWISSGDLLEDGSFFDDKDDDVYNSRYSDTVTHWMPLPEPPEVK